MKHLEWKTISYQEEWDTDNSILSVTWTEEARYRHGFLVKHVTDQRYDHKDTKFYNESLTFVEDKQ